jgi:hypothetical protein
MRGRVTAAIPWLIIAAAIVWLLGAFARVPFIPWWYLAAVGAVGVLTLLRPLHGFQAVAAFAPLAGVAVQLTAAPPFRAAESVVLASLAGFALRRAVAAGPAVPARLRLASGLFMALVVASLAVELSVRQIETNDAAPFFASFLSLMGREYFTDPRTFTQLHAAMLLLEGAALCCGVAALTREVPGSARRIHAFLVLGACGAAVLNVARVGAAALRTEHPFARMVDIVGGVRVNVHFGDVNAAGSQFALALIVAAGLAFSRDSRARAWWLAALILASGLWLTRSLSAVVGTACALALWGTVVWLRRYPWPASRYRGLVAGVAMAGIVLLAAAYGLRHLAPFDTQRAINIRADLAGVAWSMMAKAPLFGVGVGRFYPESTQYLTPLLREYYAAENAHNNFLQIAAELGLAGLAAFVWLMWAALRPAIAQVRTLPADQIAAAAAIVGFGATMMTGHPLLIPEVAFGFWIALGAAAPSMAEAPVPPRTRRAVAALAVLTIASVAVRAPAKRAATPLEHVVIGFTPWQIGEDGERYRLVLREGAFYAASDPAAPTITEIALRADGKPALVTFSVEGRPGNQMPIGAEAWQVIRLRMPPRAGGFRRITLTTDTPVRVGAIRSRGRADGS